MLKQRSMKGFSKRKTPQNKSIGASLDSMTVGFGSYTPSGWIKERAEKKARYLAMAMEDDDSWTMDVEREIEAAKAETEAEEQDCKAEQGTRIMTLVDLMQSNKITTSKNYKNRNADSEHYTTQAQRAPLSVERSVKGKGVRYMSFAQKKKQQVVRQSDELASAFIDEDNNAPASKKAISELIHDPLDSTISAVSGDEFRPKQRYAQARNSWQQRQKAYAAKRGTAVTQAQERDSDVIHAINAMVGLLAQKEYGAQELKSKCLRKFTLEAVEQALLHCQEKGYQSEERYGQMLVRHMEFSLYGPLRLKLEAQKKKVSWALLCELSADIDWDQLAYQALTKKYGITVLDYNTKCKALAYLGRRGFVSSSCMAAIQRMQQEATTKD